MKKLLLLSALLFGVVSASHAGVRVDLSLPLPVPPLPGVTVVPPPVYAPPVYSVPPSVVVQPPYLSFGFGGYGNCYPYTRYYGRGWDHRYYGHWDHRHYGHGWDHRGGHGGQGHGHW